MVRAQEQTDTCIFKIRDAQELKHHRKCLILCLSINPGAVITCGGMPPMASPPEAPQETPAPQTGSEGSQVLEGRRDWSQFQSNPCSVGSPLHRPALIDMGTAPASPEPQLAMSTYPQPHHHAQQHHETPLHPPPPSASTPCTCFSALENPGAEQVGGRMRRANFVIYRYTIELQLLRELTPHGPGFRSQGTPGATCRERSTGVTKTPPQAEEIPHVLPSHLLPQPRHRPHAEFPSDQHHWELYY